MEHSVSEPNWIQIPPLQRELPADISDWPEKARAALRDVSRELDRWCRHNDWPMATNAGLAEEAIRQAW
jgi:hypothetical protein